MTEHNIFTVTRSHILSNNCHRTYLCHTMDSFLSYSFDGHLLHKSKYAQKTFEEDTVYRYWGLHSFHSKISYFHTGVSFCALLDGMGSLGPTRQNPQSLVMTDCMLNSSSRYVTVQNSMNFRPYLTESARRNHERSSAWLVGEHGSLISHDYRRTNSKNFPSKRLCLSIFSCGALKIHIFMMCETHPKHCSCRFNCMRLSLIGAPSL